MSAAVLCSVRWLVEGILSLLSGSPDHMHAAASRVSFTVTAATYCVCLLTLCERGGLCGLCCAMLRVTRVAVGMCTRDGQRGAVIVTQLEPWRLCVNHSAAVHRLLACAVLVVMVCAVCRVLSTLPSPSRASFRLLLARLLCWM